MKGEKNEAKNWQSVARLMHTKFSKIEASGDSTKATSKYYVNNFLLTEESGKKSEKVMKEQQRWRRRQCRTVIN